MALLPAPGTCPAFWGGDDSPSRQHCLLPSVVDLPHTEGDCNEHQGCEIGHRGELGAGGQPYADGHEHVHGIYRLVERGPEADRGDDAGQAEGEGKTAFYEKNNQGNGDRHHEQGLRKSLIVFLARPRPAVYPGNREGNCESQHHGDHDRNGVCRVGEPGQP